MSSDAAQLSLLGSPSPNNLTFVPLLPAPKWGDSWESFGKALTKVINYVSFSPFFS